MRHSTCFAARYRTHSNIHLWCTRTALAVTLAMGFAASAVLPADSQSVQPPGEEFYLQVTQEDAHHIFGVMDSKNAAGVATGFVQLFPLNDPAIPGALNSQWWQDILLVSGDGDSVKLKNDATGLCIGDALSFTAVMTSCDSGESIWRRVPQPGGIVYQHAGDGYADCLGTDPDNFPGYIALVGCGSSFNGDYPAYMVWSRTTSPIGTASSPIGPPSPPPVPPKQPTSCRLDGAAVCGQVEFSCDALSASDTIVVSSGMAGVNVTSVQANIGMVNGTYLNSGTGHVSICATKPGGAFACSTPIVVSFGPRTCTNPPPPPTQLCPTGENICRGVCKPFGQCDIVR
jgi:hypothetical protein